MQNSTPSNDTSLTSNNTTANMPNTTASQSNALTAFLSCKGQFASVTFKSNPKPKAESKGVVLEKTTTGVFRAGINFANLSSVKEGIANNERGEVQSLPWGEWVNFPFVISHKGENFLRLTVAPTASIKCSFKVNGVDVSRDEFEQHLVPSARSEAKADKAPVEVFTIKEANLVSFNGEVA
jgi:hypothetical protein